MIIGLGYQARVGKGEVASWLRAKYGFTEVAFADALKITCRTIFGLNHSQLYGFNKEVVDPFWQDTPRNILQKVGTECLRNGYRDDVWVKALQRNIEMNPGRDYVISDCRFMNEVQAVRSWGGTLVCIVRPDAPAIATAQHASETSLANWTGWDHVLTNGGTLADLYAQVDDLAIEWGLRRAT